MRRKNCARKASSAIYAAAVLLLCALGVHPAWAEGPKPPPYGPAVSVIQGDQEALPVIYVITTTHTGRPAEEAAPTKAYALDIVYTGEADSLVAGGLDRRTRYLDNLDVTLNLDLDRLLGARGLSAYFYLLYNNGAGFTDGTVGDAQGVSNIETGTQAVKLYEAWLEQQLAGERATLRFGLYDLNSEFDALESANLFLNSSHGIGPDIAQTGDNGPSIFPSTSLAARLSVKLGEHVTVRLAALDGVPGDPARPRRTTVRLSRRDGALIIGELDYGVDNFRIIAGGWGYTANALDLARSLQTGADTRGPSGNRGGYVRGEWTFWRDAAREGRKAVTFARLGFADRRYNAFGSYQGGGVVATGLIPGRADDQFGLSFARASLTDRLRRQSGEAGAPLHKSETAFEMTYRAPLASWLTVQPDAQYIVHPSADPTIKDAVTLGLRFELAWSH